jgi:hypothetical protein
MTITAHHKFADAQYRGANCNGQLFGLVVFANADFLGN